MIKEEDKELELIQKITNGKSEAMKEFYTIYSGYLTTVCSRYVADMHDVKDVLQESFIRIFKAIDNFEYKGPGSLKAWSSRIVVNESLKFLKTRKKLKIINIPDWDLPDMMEEEEPDFDDISIPVILEMIRSLPPGYRTIFNLYIFEKKSHKEIASLLDITENTSASQLHRAKKLLINQINIYKSTKKRVL